MKAKLLKTLQQQFGYEGFREGQSEAISYLIEGKDTLVVMPTGSGKSLIYQFTAHQLDGVTLVVSPLISLMQDQVDHLLRQGERATYINSTISLEEQKSRLSNMANGAYKLVYVSPERLKMAGFRAKLAKTNISLLAVDEAHCIAKWGHDFRPDYLNIGRMRSELNNPLTVALTATATVAVQKEIAWNLGLERCSRVVTGFNRPNIMYEVSSCANEMKKANLLVDLAKRYQNGATIVYAGTRKDCEDISTYLAQQLRQQVGCYHAGLDVEQRTEVQDKFMQGKLNLIVATNAFGMGIDRSDVRQVIHYSLPGTLEAYYQEAGRAGRDGEESTVTLIYTPKDKALQEWFIENAAVDLHQLKQLYAHIAKAYKQGENVKWQMVADDMQVNTAKIRTLLPYLVKAGCVAADRADDWYADYQPVEYKKELLEPFVKQAHSRNKHKTAMLQQMIDYAQSTTCRRKVLLSYFGDKGIKSHERCCDVCNGHQVVAATAPTFKKLSDIEISIASQASPALNVLAAVAGSDWSFGATKLVKLLKGSKAKELSDKGYDRHLLFGSMCRMKTQEIEHIVDKLISHDYLKVVTWPYEVLELTRSGYDAVKTAERNLW